MSAPLIEAIHVPTANHMLRDLTPCMYVVEIPPQAHIHAGTYHDYALIPFRLLGERARHVCSRES